MTSLATVSTLDGLVPDALRPRRFRIFLEDFELPVDIGFHAFEVGAPQRLLVTVDVEIGADAFAAEDSEAAAWNYDFLRTEIQRLASGRRFNLQETFARAVYDLVAARQGVTGLRVATRKPDVYSDCRAVGVELSSG